MLSKIYDKVKTFILNNWLFLVIIIGLNLLFWVDLPYVIYAPGGAINVENRINANTEYDSEGKLQMAYVSMIRGSVPFLLASYVIPNWDIEPKSDLTLEDESIADMIKKDKLYLQESIDNATMASLSLLNKDFQIYKIHNTVIYVDKKADTKLKLYDEIIKADDKEITSLNDYKTIVESHLDGDLINLLVLRNGKEKNITIKVYNTEAGLKTGISLVTTYDLKSSENIQIKSKETESGPSGGLMMALGIYNILTKEDITKGKNIVGTGTIDADGNIGEIGGVKYKLIGAVKKKADIFICPEENYNEAKKVAKKENYDIIILTDKNLAGIINQLKNLK